ncbi:MAG: hypothetical protein WC787_04255 [Patescibacteria group bacterium]
MTHPADPGNSIIIKPGSPPLQTEGEELKFIHVVKTGRIFLRCEQPNPAYADFGPGSVLGWELLDIETKVCVASFTARVPSDYGACTVRRFETAAFLFWLKQRPDALGWILKSIHHKWSHRTLKLERERSASSKTSGTRTIDQTTRQAVETTAKGRKPIPREESDEDDEQRETPTSPGHRSAANWRAQKSG